MRGLGDPEAARAVPHPAMEHLHDPFLLADMGKAVERIERALATKERIAIHGDYDVDGITSTVILRRALEMLGGDVVHFIPERLRDGYGLQPAAIDRLHGEGVQLDHLGRLRHPRHRSGAARARARRRSDHHGSPRAGRHAAAGAGRDQSEAARLHLSGQEPRGRRRRAEAGPGAVPARRQGEVAAGVRRRSPRSARSPTSSRSSARTASSRSSGSRRSARDGTPSACARCSRRRG